MLAMTGFMAVGCRSLLPEFGNNDKTPTKVDNNYTKHHTEKCFFLTMEVILVIAKCISNAMIIRAFVFTLINVELVAIERLLQDLME